MPIEEAFNNLYDKYGDAFNWSLIPPSNRSFVRELKKELGKLHFLYGMNINAAAKCDSNDEVLFIMKNRGLNDVYYIFHLTYSRSKESAPPEYKKFHSINEVMEYIESSFIENYM